MLVHFPLVELACIVDGYLEDVLRLLLLQLHRCHCVPPSDVVLVQSTRVLDLAPGEAAPGVPLIPHVDDAAEFAYLCSLMNQAGFTPEFQGALPVVALPCVWRHESPSLLLAGLWTVWCAFQPCCGRCWQRC